MIPALAQQGKTILSVLEARGQSSGTRACFEAVVNGALAQLAVSRPSR